MKRPYQAVSLSKVNVETLKSEIAGEAVTVGIDAAKTDFVATVMGRDRTSFVTVKWRHPGQTLDFIAFTQSLGAKSVNYGIEPTGSYSSSLVEQLLRRSHSVFLVAAKRVHDARELFDGVPSQHDGKSAAIVARLQLDGLCKPWPVKDEEARELRAVLKSREIYREQFDRARNRLEGMLAAHWPEVTETFDLDSVALLALLSEYGSPQAVIQNAHRCREVMRQAGGPNLAEEKIEAALQLAAQTLGVPTVEAEADHIRLLATEMRRCHQEMASYRRKLARLSAACEATRSMAQVVGSTTAAVIVTMVGDPADFPASQAYEKAAGLNLQERSSGTRHGRLRITKRGSGVVRKYLFLAVWRLIQKDAVVAAWYQRKVARDAGLAMKAMIAVMRKLIRALWHVRRGASFDSSKLFDTSRLGLDTGSMVSGAPAAGP